MEYQPLAFSSSNLFFCIADLNLVDPMYQYSLRWFIALFQKAVKDAEPGPDVHARTHHIDKTFQYALYRNVCRSLFEKDKLLFSFLLCLRVLQGRNEMDQSELRYLLTGGAVELGFSRPNPTELKDSKDATAEEKADSKWLSDSSWAQLCQLGLLTKFKDLPGHVSDHQRQWKLYYENSDPFSRPLPNPWDSLNSFQKLLVLRCFRPDKLISSIQLFVADTLGKEFITPPPFDLPTSFLDSSSASPLVFILSPGVDPSKDIFKLATTMNFNTPERLFSISLGQGQGPFAENAIREAIDAGTWVVLQNCHLAVSWMPTLEKIVDEINPLTTNPDFRLWLTSMPTPDFPVSILQNGVKMTNEPAAGIRANLGQTYRMFEDGIFLDCKRPEEYKKLLFGLSFFHAIVLERRKFGPLGWNILYEFTESDLSISKRQLKMFLDLYEETPFKALRYLVGQLNYGGRVTDDWDRRTLTYILEDFFSERILDDDYKFDLAGIYHCPNAAADLDDYRNYISKLPKFDDSEVFGLHENVNITTAIKESNGLFNTLLSLQPKSTTTTGAGARDIVVQQLAHDVETKLPPNFDIESAAKQYPVVYGESMNTVLVQELMRFNKLLDVVKSSLVNLQRAIKGEVVMSFELEKAANSMFDGQVPELWAAVAYPSLKPLGSWVVDLLKRLQMFSDWIRFGRPTVYWISGFFFTQSFLTGTMQNFARCYAIPIDEIAFDFEVKSNLSAAHNEAPKDGVYVYGLFLEGARWDTTKGVLTEPLKRQLYSELPVIWLKPVEANKLPTNRLVYPCPVYKTSKRAGTLTTTGHSSNFVLTIHLRSLQHERHWVKRGAALLCQLDD